MKLFKKLLPIASLASVAAVTVPLVTACKGGISGVTVDIADFILNGYTRHVEALPATTQLTEQQGLKTYLSAIADQKEIFADDIFEDLELLVYKILEESFGAHNPVVNPTVKPLLTDMEGSVTVGNINANADKETISAALGIDLFFPIQISTQVDPIYLDIDIEAGFKNFGVRMSASDKAQILDGKPYYRWLLCSDYVPIISPKFNGVYNGEAKRDLRTDKDWSITLKGSIGTNYVGLGGDIKLDSVFNSESDQLVLILLSMLLSGIVPRTASNSLQGPTSKNFGIPAMYFKNVAPAVNVDKE